MIHFWEPTLKGHGIPEAMEAVLIGKSKVRTARGNSQTSRHGVRHWHRWTVRRRGAHYSNRSSTWLDLRAIDPPHALPEACVVGVGTPPPAWPPLLLPLRWDSGSDRAAALRVSRALVHPRSAFLRHGHRRRRALPRLGAALSYARLRAGQHAGTLALCPDGNRHGHHRHRHDPGAFLSGRCL